MKSLLNILNESILSANGPETLGDNKLAMAIYASLKKLPKADVTMYGRNCYKPDTWKKFNKPIMAELEKLIKSGEAKQGNIDLKKDVGIAIRTWRDGGGCVLAWDKSDYILTRIEDLTIPAEDGTVDWDNWKEEQFWTVLVDPTEPIGYIHEMIEWNNIDHDWYFYPCFVDMGLIKKLWYHNRK